MKKVLVVMLVLGFCMSLAGLVFAQAQTDTDKSIQEIMRNQALLKAKEMLEGREWVIYTKPSEGKKIRVETDVLTFKDGTVTSKNLSAQGYGTSNYTPSVQDDGTAIWETMQVRNDVDLIFLRGELRGTTMRGAMGTKPQKGLRESFDFTTEVVASAVEVQAEETQAVAPVVKVKTKKGKK